MTDIKQYLGVMRAREFPFALISLFLLIAPGLLVIFHYFNAAFMEMETMKLVFLSISIASPLVFVFLIQALNELEDVTPEDKSFLSLIMSISLSGLDLLVCLGVSYVAGYSVKQFIALVFGAALFTLISIHVMEKHDRKKRLKNENAKE